MLKTLREAKLHSTWASPNAAYEYATLAFMRSALDLPGRNAFLDVFPSVSGAGVLRSVTATVWCRPRSS